MNKVKYILMLLLVACLCAVDARVFRLGGNREDRLNTAGLPWEGAYTTTMELNGERCELDVYSAHRNDPVVDQLRHQLERQGGKVFLQEAAGMVRGVARFEDRDVRFLVLSPDSLENRLVFLFYPEPADASGPARLPVPEYPGAKISNVVKNEKTGTVCATMETMDGPDQVQAYYAGVLYANGWATVVPAVQGKARMAMYSKGEQVCTVFATSGHADANRVTLLVKGGRL